MQHTQDLLAAGIIVIVLALAVPNFKAFALGSIGLVKSPASHPKIDWSRLKIYLAWVFSLTIAFGLYNLALTQNMSDLSKTTGIEFLLLAAGLVCVILYKKDKSDRN